MHILYVCTYGYVHTAAMGTAAYLLHINMNQRSSTTHLFLTFKVFSGVQNGIGLYCTVCMYGIV
jgi:hypothetical protein